MGKERYPHPAQKSLRLLKHILNIASNPGDLVLDPFMGVGSTAVACKQLNRNVIGMEVNPTYFAMAKERMGETKAGAA